MKSFADLGRRVITLTRRRLLLLPFAAAITAGWREADAALIDGAKTARDPLESLPSYLDTLIPHFLGPSATELGAKSAGCFVETL